MTFVAAASVSACRTIDGQVYPAWTGSVAKTDCRVATSDGGSGILVSVLDWDGRPLPGATVTASSVSTLDKKSVQSGRDGVALERLPAGSWSLEAWLPGFRRVSVNVVASNNELCSVRCFLVLGDGTGVVH
jgi:hypothetical protein